jgi:hypothetical protein
MKKGKRKVGFNFKELKYKKEILVVLAVIVGAIAIYQTFSPQGCGDFGCFSERMKTCSPTKYINEGEDASWLYQIQGIDGNNCAVRVTLLNAKEGDLGLRDFEGNAMTCFYEKGSVAYPERNMGSCTGILKEDLQGLVIERLYDYVVTNLGDIKEDLLFS